MATAPPLLNVQHFFRNYLARNDVNYDVVNAALSGLASLVAPQAMRTIDAATAEKAFDLAEVVYQGSEALAKHQYSDVQKIFVSHIENSTPLLLGEEPLGLCQLPLHLQGELYLGPGEIANSAKIAASDQTAEDGISQGILIWRPEYPNGRYARLSVIDLQRNTVLLIGSTGSTSSVFADVMHEFSLLFPIEAWYSNDKRTAFIQESWRNEIPVLSTKTTDKHIAELQKAYADAQVCEAGGDHKGVLELLQPWAQHMEGEGAAELQLLRIVSLKRLGRHDEAETALALFSVDHPHYPMEQLILGDLAWRDERWMTVLLAYLEAINREPQLQDLWPRVLFASERLAELNRASAAGNERLQALISHMVNTNLPVNMKADLLRDTPTTDP
ncbi:MAG: hypothetical protein ACOYMY_04990 [Prochlorococcaceae cyanobacterium]